VDNITILGLVAGTLTTVSFLPQIIKIWRSRSTKDISLVMFVIYSVGIFLWLVYGIYINALPVIVTNSVTLVLALAIVIFKIRYK
jgi:MtN3 and saliva related transmembrane protein